MMFCSGTHEKGWHKPCMMKYFHTSDGCVHFACPSMGCGKVVTVCRTLPPIWIRKRGYKPNKQVSVKKHSILHRILGPR